MMFLRELIFDGSVLLHIISLIVYILQALELAFGRKLYFWALILFVASSLFMVIAHLILFTRINPFSHPDTSFPEIGSYKSGNDEDRTSWGALFRTELSSTISVLGILWAGFLLLEGSLVTILLDAGGPFQNSLTTAVLVILGTAKGFLGLIFNVPLCCSVVAKWIMEGPEHNASDVKVYYAVVFSLPLIVAAYLAILTPLLWMQFKPILDLPVWIQVLSRIAFYFVYLVAVVIIAYSILKDREDSAGDAATDLPWGGLALQHPKTIRMTHMANKDPIRHSESPATMTTTLPSYPLPPTPPPQTGSVGEYHGEADGGDGSGDKIRQNRNSSRNVGRKKGDDSTRRDPLTDTQVLL